MQGAGNSAVCAASVAGHVHCLLGVASASIPNSAPGTRRQGMAGFPGDPFKLISATHTLQAPCAPPPHPKPPPRKGWVRFWICADVLESGCMYLQSILTPGCHYLHLLPNQPSGEPLGFWRRKWKRRLLVGLVGSPPLVCRHHTQRILPPKGVELV